MKSNMKTPRAAANEFVARNAHLSLPKDAGPGRNPRGVVCAANEERFTASHYSEPLTTYSVGWRDPENLQTLLDFICGASVPVGRRFEFKKNTNAEYFISETDDERAIGSTFKRVEYTGSSVNLSTVNRGLTTREDRDEVNEVNDPQWRERKVELLKTRLLRNAVRRAIAALAAGMTNTTPVWSPTAPTEGDPVPNPDGDLTNAMITAADASGISPNRALYGQKAWQYRRLCYAAQTLGGYVMSNSTPKQVADAAGLDDIMIAAARYQSSATGKTAIVPAVAYLYYALPGVSMEEPSNIKRFLSMTSGGTPFRVYIDEQDKFVDISVEHYDLVFVPNTLGMESISPTQS